MRYERTFDADFNRFDLSTLSPSSINTYLEEPAYWVVRYLKKVKGYSGANMIRGTATEQGLKAYYFSPHAREDDARNFAMQYARINFMQNCGDAFRDTDDEKAYDEMQEYLAYLLTLPGSVLPPRDRKPLTQLRVEARFDNVPVPVIGYLDFDWEGFPTVDLKTASRIPSEAKPSHGRQVALYSHARNKPSILLYVSPKKHAKIEIDWEDHQGHLADLTRGARAITQLLRRSTSVEEVAELFVPQYDSFYWDRETIPVAEKIWR